MGTFTDTDILDGRYHGIYGFGVKEGWWSGKMGVTEISKVFPFLVFPPYPLYYFTWIIIYEWILTRCII